MRDAGRIKLPSADGLHGRITKERIVRKPIHLGDRASLCIHQKPQSHVARYPCRQRDRRIFRRDEVDQRKAVSFEQQFLVRDYRLQSWGLTDPAANPHDRFTMFFFSLV